jgi:hypothetical protein
VYYVRLRSRVWLDNSGLEEREGNGSSEICWYD